MCWRCPAVESTVLNSLRLIYESACICGVHTLRLYHISIVLLLLKLLKLEATYLSFQTCCKRACVAVSGKRLRRNLIDCQCLY